MADPIPLIQIEKPELGRASDDRLTQDYIDARPELAGFPAFMPGVDVDLVGQINDRMASLHSLVKYASPELAAGLIGVLGDVSDLIPQLEQLKADIEQSAANLNTASVPNNAALTGKPAAAYRVVDTGQTVWWNGTAITQTGPTAATAALVARSVAASVTILTPEEFGAPADFDPVYAAALGIGSPGWTAYLAGKNASLAHAKMLQAIKIINGPVRVQASGRYYLGPLSGTDQRLYGRQIYGANESIYTLGGGSAQAVYERMPVVAEGIKNLEWQGLGCTYYQSARAGASSNEPDTLMAFYQCEDVHFTGLGTMYGFTPPTVTTDTENAALLRFGIGTQGFSTEDGWHLGAFLGDGVNIGGTRFSGGSDNPAHAAYHGRIDASIRERYGNGERPWSSADGATYIAPDGVNHGTKSRLAVSVVHASDIKITSKEIYGSIDVEPNSAAQLAVDIECDVKIRSRGIVPHTGSPHPWQEEALTIPGAAGSVELEAYITYTSVAATAAAVRGKIEATIDKGYIYMHTGMKVPIERATFTVSGNVRLGNLSSDVGKTTDGAVVRNVTAPAVLQSVLYTQTGTTATIASLIFLSGNVRNPLIQNCSVESGALPVIGLNPVSVHTGGNSEQGGRYIANKSTGLTGQGKVLGFAAHATSRAVGNVSTIDLTTPPILNKAYVPVEATLTVAGKLDTGATPAACYVVTPNSGTSQTFTGLLNPASVADDTRIIIRVADGNTLTISANGGVGILSNVGFSLGGLSEMEFRKVADTRLIESRRSLVPNTTLAGAVTGPTLIASATYTQAELQATNERVNSAVALLNNLKAALAQQGIGNN